MFAADRKRMTRSQCMCMFESVYTLWCLCVFFLLLTNRYHNDVILNAPKEFLRCSLTKLRTKITIFSTILIPILLWKLSDRVFFLVCLQYSNTLNQSQFRLWLLSLVSFHCVLFPFGFAGLNTEGNFPLRSQFCIANSVWIKT